MIPDSALKRLTTERKLDRETGQSSTGYFWDGQPVPQVKLTGAIADQMSGMALIQKDLANALRWLDAAVVLLGEINKQSDAKTDETSYTPITNREVGDKIKSFFVSSLIFYAKAFTEAAGRRAQMARNSLAPEFRDTHDYFMMFRHNMAAHSGDEKLEIGHTYIFLTPSNTGHDVRLGTHRCQPDLALAEGDEIRFHDLIQHAIEKISERYSKAAKKTIELAAAKGSKYWINAYERDETIDATELHKDAT